MEPVTPGAEGRTGEGWTRNVRFGVTTVGVVRFRRRRFPVRLEQATEGVFAVHEADGAVVGSLRLRWLIVVGGRHSVADALVWAMLVEELSYRRITRRMKNRG